jgi:uncharacterized membrane protein
LAAEIRILFTQQQRAANKQKRKKREHKIKISHYYFTNVKKSTSSLYWSVIVFIIVFIFVGKLCNLHMCCYFRLILMYFGMIFFLPGFWGETHDRSTIAVVLRTL